MEDGFPEGQLRRTRARLNIETILNRVGKRKKFDLDLSTSTVRPPNAACSANSGPELELAKLPLALRWVEQVYALRLFLSRANSDFSSLFAPCLCVCFPAAARALTFFCFFRACFCPCGSLDLEFSERSTHGNLFPPPVAIDAS